MYNVRRCCGGEKSAAAMSTNRVVFSRTVRDVYAYLTRNLFFVAILRGQNVTTDRRDQRRSESFLKTKNLDGYKTQGYRCSVYGCSLRRKKNLTHM